MPKKPAVSKKVKFNKNKAPNDTFLIESAFQTAERHQEFCNWHGPGNTCNECGSSVPDLYTYFGLWGDRKGKIMLKLRKCEEYEPFSKDTPYEEKMKRIEAFNVYDERYTQSRWPRKWKSVKHLVFSWYKNPDKPRLFEIDFGKHRRMKTVDISYHTGFNSLFSMKDPLVNEFMRMICLARGIEYTEDFRPWMATMPLLANMVKYGEYPAPNGGHMNIVQGRLFRHRNLTEAAHYLFGRAGKEHKASLSAWLRWRQWGPIYAATAAKGLVPDEYLRALSIGSVFNKWHPHETEDEIKLMRNLLRNVTVEARKKLMTDDKSDNGYGTITQTIQDTQAAYNELQREGINIKEMLRRRMPTTWEEYHNILNDRINQIRRDKQAVKYKAMKMANNANATCLHESEFMSEDGVKYRIIVPDNGLQVVDWGNEMQHCIGSYAEKMAAGKCLLFGVYKQFQEDGHKLRYKLIATGEIGEKRIRQLYSKRNTALVPSEDQLVRQHVHRVLPDISPRYSSHYSYTFYGPVFHIPGEPGVLMDPTTNAPVRINNRGEEVAPAPAGLPQHIDHHQALGLMIDDFPF